MFTGKHLSRRTLLRGLGAALPLPFLDSMVPAFAAPAARLGTTAAKRMAFIYVPNGIIMQDWTPEKSGPLGEFKRILKPFEPVREKLTVLSGLTHNTGRALGDGPGDHARAASTFLTGIHPKKTPGSDFSLGVSVDQIAARHIGRTTRLPSLELSLEGGKQAGNCDSGYSCVYSNNVSWSSPTMPNPPEINPRVVFERLFGDADPSESAELRARRLQLNKSILDLVASDTASLRSSLGVTDKRKLDEYLTAVREIEQRLQRVDTKRPFTSMQRPDGIPDDYEEHAKLIFDLMTIAFQADLTRVITLMMACEGSNRPYREIGVSESHHGLSHHMNKADWIEKLTKINEYHAKQFSYWLQRLNAIPDGDGTLLDNSMIVYGSSLRDGNAHTHDDLPILLAGRGAGTVKPGRHVQYPSETPMTNLYLSMLDRLGVPENSIGDSTGVLSGLSDLA